MRSLRRAGIPNVLSLHGGDLYDPAKRTSPHRHPVLRVWIRHLLRRADLVIGQSTNTLENMRRFYANVPAVRIPLAIPRPPLEVGSRDTYGLAKDDIVLVTVGRLVARKAVAQLITDDDALRGSKARLLVIGSGPEEPRPAGGDPGGRPRRERSSPGRWTARKFRSLRLVERVRLHQPARRLGLVFLEAMATGPADRSATTTAGRPTSSAREFGYLVPLNDLDGFRECCEALIGDADRRGEIGRANLELRRRVLHRGPVRRVMRKRYLASSSADVRSKR
jgi:glycosyltransferase involved in cell wall biosynthesis